MSKRFIVFLLIVAALATTRSPLAAQAAGGAVPSPAAVFGHAVGESGWLADWAQITDYFARLEAASPLVKVDTIGTSVEGRPMIMATITSVANQIRLSEIRSSQARLADPRGSSAEELERLARTQPAVLFIGASLHGDEIMATQMSMELAHALATDTALIRQLDEVVVLLVPGMNPDGLDLSRAWWLRTRKTVYAGSPMPWLYHHYAGHDINRDFFMLTQPETRAINRVLYHDWFPQVVYDVHQMGSDGARFFVPPFADPLNPNLDPLLVRETNLIGAQIALDLTAAGKPGVSHVERYDLWWHGGARTVPARHNMVGILTEAASARFGDPVVQGSEELTQPDRGSLYPEPWEGGEWTPRQIVEYELIAAQSIIRLLARQREDFVRNFATLALRQIELGTAGDPFAWVIPADQDDPGTAAALVRLLRETGVEVLRATQPFAAEGVRVAAGSYVIPMAQPFRAHAKDLLEIQVYPEVRRYPNGPIVPPYDLTGWSLPLQMGVLAIPVGAPFRAPGLALVDSVPVPPGKATGSGTAIALDPTLNATHRVIHEVLSEGVRGRVTFSAAPVVTGSEVWPAGTPVISGVQGLPERLARWTREWGVNVAAVDAIPPGRSVRGLRVGLYRSWVAEADEGWTRWLFEEWGVPYQSLRDGDIRAGGLLARFDAIVVPDLEYHDLMRGLDPARTPAEYAGGLGLEGAAALREFVQGGGTLVLLGASSDFAIRELDVAVRDVTRSAARWYAPGSLLVVEWANHHPLAAGMPPESAVFYANGPVFALEPRPGVDDVTVVARYPEDGLLVSGYAQGEEQVAGMGALVDARLGAGRVILFGFRPQHRGQTHDTFKVLFNALYLR